MIEQSRHTGFPVYVQLKQKLCLRQESAGNTKNKLSVLYSIFALIFGTPNTFVAGLRSLFCWRKMILIGYNNVNKAHNRYSPLSPATSTFRLLFMENWIHEEQMFRNTTWFASLRNTLSPSIMIQWKTTPNEKVQLLLETSHFSLHHDYGRKATFWTKTTESETSQPTFRWFAALPLWRDRWFFSGVLQGFLVLQAARGWSFMLIQCLYLDLLHAYKFTYILYTIDLWLYIVFTFPHRLWIFTYLNYA